jgi:hypothetical protein
MITKLKDAEIDPIRKQAITELEDSFGHRHIVQTMLLAPGANHAADVAAGETLLQTNEDAFRSQLTQMGKTAAQIAALEIH